MAPVSAARAYVSDPVEMTAEVAFLCSLKQEVEQNVSFGVVEIDPGGDRMVFDANAVDDTENTDADDIDSKSGRSQVFDRPALGSLKLTLPEGRTLKVAVIYPQSVELVGGSGRVILTEMDKNSTYNSTPKPMDGGDHNIYIGGVLEYDEATVEGTYSAEFEVMVTYQ